MAFLKVTDVLPTPVGIGDAKIHTFRDAAVCCVNYALSGESKQDLGFEHIVKLGDGMRLDITKAFDGSEDAKHHAKLVEAMAVSPIAGLLLKLPKSWARELVTFLQHPWNTLNRSYIKYSDWPETAAYGLLEGGMRYGPAVLDRIGKEARAAIRPWEELKHARQADGSYLWAVDKEEATAGEKREKKKREEKKKEKKAKKKAKKARKAQEAQEEDNEEKGREKDKANVYDFKVDVTRGKITITLGASLLVDHAARLQSIQTEQFGTSVCDT